MEWKIAFHRMNSFYISLLTMKSSIAFGTVYNINSFRRFLDKKVEEGATVCWTKYGTFFLAN
jgi:hypothetical protein